MKRYLKLSLFFVSFSLNIMTSLQRAERSQIIHQAQQEFDRRYQPLIQSICEKNHPESVVYEVEIDQRAQRVSMSAIIKLVTQEVLTIKDDFCFRHTSIIAHKVKTHKKK